MIIFGFYLLKIASLEVTLKSHILLILIGNDALQVGGHDGSLFNFLFLALKF